MADLDNADAENPAATFGRAVALHKSGQLADAVVAYRRVVAMAPRFPAAHANLAVALRALGQPQAAIAACDAVLAIKPDYADAHSIRGNTLVDVGEADAALASLEAAVTLEPGQARLHSNLANALLSLERPGPALESLDRAIALDARYTPAHFNRGNALRMLGDYAGALDSYDAALALDAGHFKALVNRGDALNQLRRNDEALASLDAAVAIDPRDPAAHYNRANVLVSLGRVEEAVLGYDRTLSLDPNYPGARCNHALALSQLNRGDEALASLDAAIAIDPRDPAFHYNRANVLVGLGRAEAAVLGYDRTLSLDPNYEGALWNRTLALLKLERFSQGWPDFEARWGREEFVANSAAEVTPPLRARLDPNLQAGDLVGRKVLLVEEEGVGDVVMFASIVPDVLAAAASVSLLCTPRLHGLISHAFPQVRVLRPGADDWSADHFDHVLAIGSLGRLYRHGADDFPRTPYVSAGPAVLERWRQRLGPKTTPLRAGLSWRGGTDRTGGADRSIPLAALTPLLKLPECEFISLQYGAHGAEVAAVNATLDRPVREFPAETLNDLEDLTGLAQSLDVVVSVQTALVHLCGAAGVPCLVLLPFVTAWRYGARPSSMPWYSSVNLVRQDAGRQWPPVIDEVATRLRALAKA